MSRETKIRWLLLLAAAAVTAAVLAGVYAARPLRFYSVEPQPAAPPVSATPAPVSAPTEEPASSSAAQEVLVEKSVNINTATLEELDQLPGVGPAIAQRILDYREANNGFYDIEELMEVSGIGEKTFQKLEPYITAE